MSFRRRARHDDANHGEIVQALRAAGRQVVELDGAKQDEPGIPDLLVAWPGGLVLMEIKSVRERARSGRAEKPQPGRLNDAQLAWHAAYRGPRATLVTVWTVSEALAATGARV